MAYWGTRSVRYKTNETPFKLNGGENTYLPAFDIDRSESTYSRNLTSKGHTSMSVRSGRQHAFDTAATPYTLGQRDNTYPHVQSGTDWKRWSGSAWVVVQASLTGAVGRFLEFNTEADRFTVLVNGTNKYAWNGTSVTTLTDAPATKLYTVDDYRLYALIGTELKCSALGSVTDWTTADDADSITLTSAKGTGTALAAYNDVVISWTEQSMHVLYGNDPYDFYMNDPINDGCISDRSVIEHRGKLYFLDFGAYKVYTGGRPSEISQKIKTYLDGINLTYKDKCVAGKQGKYIYLSIPYGAAVTTNTLTLEYDTELGTWYPHNVGYVDFVTIGEHLYGVDSSGVLWDINSGTADQGTAIAWDRITGVWNYGTSKKKVISELYMTIDLPISSTFLIYYSTTVDGDDFTLLYTATASASEQNTRVQIPTNILQNIDWYRLEFTGTGPCTIFSLEEHSRVKSR